jgi:hypothetical protein
MHDRAGEDRSAGRGGRSGRTGVDSSQRLQTLLRDVTLCDDTDNIPFITEDCAEEALAQPHRALDDDVEHRLNIIWRPGDDPQDLARCRLLVEGFGDLPVRLYERLILLLQLLEQAHVLDGDDGLIGEGLE